MFCILWTEYLRLRLLLKFTVVTFHIANTLTDILKPVHDLSGLLINFVHLAGHNLLCLDCSNLAVWLSALPCVHISLYQ